MDLGRDRLMDMLFDTEKRRHARFRVLFRAVILQNVADPFFDRQRDSKLQSPLFGIHQKSGHLDPADPLALGFEQQVRPAADLHQIFEQQRIEAFLVADFHADTAEHRTAVAGHAFQIHDRIAFLQQPVQDGRLAVAGIAAEHDRPGLQVEMFQLLDDPSAVSAKASVQPVRADAHQVQHRRGGPAAHSAAPAEHRFLPFDFFELPNEFGQFGLSDLQSALFGFFDADLRVQRADFRPLRVVEQRNVQAAGNGRAAVFRRRPDVDRRDLSAGPLGQQFFYRDVLKQMCSLLNISAQKILSVSLKRIRQP